MNISYRSEANAEQCLSLTVLLVDDAEIDRQVYRRYLQTHNPVTYRCLEAETLEEGLVLYQQEQPDITLLDFSLPDGDGLEFLTQISDDIAELKWPVVMLTGQGDERIAAKAIKLGAADYLVKQDLTATALQIAVVQTHQNSLLRQQLERSRQQEAITTAIALKIRQSLDLQTILDGAVQEVQKSLNADRILIYRLTPETDRISGEILAEAVVPPWTASLHQQVKDECLQASAIEKYHQGYAFVVNDVAASDLTDCHKQLLARFQVKANLAVPILFTDQSAQTDYLWGLLIAHQCASPRQWHPPEIRFLQRLSVQLAIAIQQAELYQSLQRLNQELVETNVELRQATRLMKNEFLANMSHELRTPLTAILGMSELMLEGIYDPLNTDQTKATNTIARSAQHLLGLINEILDLAKIESGKMTLKPEPCYVVTLCEDCLQFVRSQANKQGLSLRLNVAPTVGRVELDSRRIRQALINLLSNAVKFTPQGGSVTLQVERAGAWLNFHVIDTGIGIADGDRHKLFQPFTQLDSQLNRQYEGTGLGLALVKRIAELHQGTITFTSVPHQGSHFTLAIPYKPVTKYPEFPAVPVGTTDVTPVAIPKALRLLIADDDPDTVAALEDYLSARGYDLCFADNGITAINQIYQQHPDLVIMDIQMPVMDGLDAIAHIRRDPTLQNLPIIAATALAMPQEREQCLAAGATDYISKPVKLSQLDRLIRSLLAKAIPAGQPD